MKLIRHTAALSAALALAACTGGDTHNAQGNSGSNAMEAEANTLENASETLEGMAGNATGNTADALSNQAEAVSNAAENHGQTTGNTTSNSH